MIDRMKLLDTLLDNQDLNDEALVVLIENEIAAGIAYNHKAEHTRDACGIKEGDRDTSILSKKYSKTSEQVKATEETFSKRELAYMFVVSHIRSKGIERKLESLEELLQMITKSGLDKKK